MEVDLRPIGLMLKLMKMIWMKLQCQDHQDGLKVSFFGCCGQNFMISILFFFITARPTGDSIHVSWGPPAEQEIKVRGYIIGWGKGIPDEETAQVDENVRTYQIKNLGELLNHQKVSSFNSNPLSLSLSEPNSEYVISLRARLKSNPNGRNLHCNLLDRHNPLEKSTCNRQSSLCSSLQFNR